MGRLVAIPSGSYTLRFAFGERYSRAQKRFCILHGASEFDRTIEFEEIEDDEGIVYSVNSISLHKTVTGNARTHSIDPKTVFADSV